MIRQEQILAMESEWKECPFGIRMRFCEYQETRAKDLSSMVLGDLKFFCKLEDLVNCPKLKEVIYD